MRSLRELCNALHNIDEVKHDPTFGPHYQIEIPQTHVEVDDATSRSHLRQRRTERSSGSCLADATLARRHDQYFRAILFSLTGLIQWCDFHDFAFQPCLSWMIAQGGVDFFCSRIVAVDGEQLGFDLLTENPRCSIAIEAIARPRSAP